VLVDDRRFDVDGSLLKLSCGARTKPMSQRICGREDVRRRDDVHRATFRVVIGTLAIPVIDDKSSNRAVNGTLVSQAIVKVIATTTAVNGLRYRPLVAQRAYVGNERTWRETAFVRIGSFGRW